jgi:D-3-phosphoglycerate dehydrogenase
MAQIATELLGEVPVHMDIQVKGEIAVHDSSILAISALKGALIAVGAEEVTYVNTPGLATERGMTSAVTTTADSPEYRSMISLRAATGSGKSMTVDGTLMGIKQTQKIIGIDSFSLDLPPTAHILFLQYVDQPGIIGTVGHTLGQAKINIAGMQVGRSAAGGKALMALSVDSDVSDDLLATIKRETSAESVRAVVLVD